MLATTAARPIDFVPAHDRSDAQSASRPTIFTSADLLQGCREAWIEHGDQLYRLRLTSAGKLYLTK